MCRYILNIDSPDQKDYKTLNLCKFSRSLMFEQIQQEIWLRGLQTNKYTVRGKLRSTVFNHGAVFPWKNSTAEWLSNRSQLRDQAIMPECVNNKTGKRRCSSCVKMKAAVDTNLEKWKGSEQPPLLDEKEGPPPRNVSSPSSLLVQGSRCHHQHGWQRQADLVYKGRPELVPG